MTTKEETGISMQEHIYRRVCAFAEKNRIFENCSLVVAGVSGGGDSMSMLDMLQRLSGEYGFEVRAVHVNHGIRGAEALRDQHFVEEICKKWEIPCRVYSYDVPYLAQRWKNGLEEAGRKVRADAFREELMRAQNCYEGALLTALAHNKNDLAETMLHHLCRGSGLRGLSPLEAKKDGIIRPVLCLERKEIDEYLKEREIPFVQDSTNLEDSYTRNRLRHHVLPVLEAEINERAVSHMAETAGLLGQAERYFTWEGRNIAEKCRLDENTCLFGGDFSDRPEILQSYAVREAIELLSGRRRDLSMVHVKKVLELFEGRTGAGTDLPYGLKAERAYEGILLKKKEYRRAEVQKSKECPLFVNGSTHSPLGSFETKVFSWSGQKIFEKKYTKWLDYDKIKDDIFIRTRKTGDYLIVNSEGCRKKLTRCMIDEKIPREIREEIPLLAAGSEILWIVGGRINEKYKITSDTKNVLEIKYQGGKQNE